MDGDARRSVVGVATLPPISLRLWFEMRQLWLAAADKRHHATRSDSKNAAMSCRRAGLQGNDASMRSDARAMERLPTDKLSRRVGDRAGNGTKIELEVEYWDGLDEIIRRERTTLVDLVAEIQDRLSTSGAEMSTAQALTVFVAAYFRRAANLSSEASDGGNLMQRTVEAALPLWKAS